MKKCLTILITSVCVFIMAGGFSWAQTTAPNEDTFELEEIIVTSEKREVNIQEIPASVVALEGASLIKQGRISTAQILESVPNVTFRPGDEDNPNGNITIRGVQKTQQTGGGNSPASTATYVDGVYQGIGGGYDINRVEILRGPQGTLYGRSATGGVVAFYTNDPKLSEYSGYITAEYGTAKLTHIQGALNVPLGDSFAIRGAGRYYSQGEGYFNGEGGKFTIKEGRIKALYQPSEQFEALLSLSAGEYQPYSGGNSPILTAPNTFDYDTIINEVIKGNLDETRQASLTVNYDFGESTLTYIGAIHTYESGGGENIATRRNGIMRDTPRQPEGDTQTHEMRLASDSDGALTWLVGGNYYQNTYERSNASYLVAGFIPGDPGDPVTIDPDPNIDNTLIWGNNRKGEVTNYGFFTEETYEVRDDFRITAGLRIDKTKVDQDLYYKFNVNRNEWDNAINPEILNEFNADHLSKTFTNTTYKIRFEYDLTPDNMLYAMTSTGFLPGDQQLSPRSRPGSVEFHLLPFEQEELTAYEAGSKNRFFNNRLQLNGAAFYLDYEGYQEAINTAVTGTPFFTVVAVPVKMIGLEIDGEWLLTPSDKVSFSAGWLDAKIKSYPDIPGAGNAKDFMALEELPGNAKFKATAGYDHTFLFNNASTLVPRVEFRYTGGYYLSQMNQEQASGTETSEPQGPYSYQDAYVIGDVGTTWTSANTKFSVTGYVRNVFDKEYKSRVNLAGGRTTTVSVTPGDPRTFGIMVTARF